MIKQIESIHYNGQKQKPVSASFKSNPFNIQVVEQDNQPAISKRSEKMVTKLMQRLEQQGTPPLFKAEFESRYRKYNLEKGSLEIADPFIEEIPAGTLYLFNVIVALEWHPSERYQSQLRRAFRRASDFLYDVTDGQMAFGKVILGGPELMDCADIQIMASNRLHPRTWIDGLFEDEEYKPIRVGRGLWHQGYNVTIPWHEPEGYRLLVHEWGHYALGLPDEYLKPSHNGSGEKLIIPTYAPDSYSFMASPIWSELFEEKNDEILQLVTSRYPSFKKRDLDGPEGLPLALPRFHALPALTGSANGSCGELRVLLPQTLRRCDVEYDHDRCWLYLLRRTHNEPHQFEHLLPQGSLEVAPQQAHSKRFCRITSKGGEHHSAKSNQFRLLRTSHDEIHQINDIIALVAEIPDQGLTVFQCEVSPHGSGAFASPYWTYQIFDNAPLVAIVPTLSHSSNNVRVSIQLRGSAAPQTLRLYPLGDSPSKEIKMPADKSEWLSEPIDLPTLDGHILLQWPDGKIMIYPFSQGGDPEGHGGMNAPPVTAGSADGNVMLFFDEASAHGTHNESHDRHDLKVITTLTQAPSQDKRVGSNIYSLASNNPLPEQYTPTLVLYYDSPTSGPAAKYDHKPILRRLADDGTWQELPQSYARPGNSFVAIPLNAKTAPKLTEKHSESACVESYQLYWKPMRAA